MLDRSCEDFNRTYLPDVQNHLTDLGFVPGIEDSPESSRYVTNVEHVKDAP